MGNQGSGIWDLGMSRLRLLGCIGLCLSLGLEVLWHRTPGLGWGFQVVVRRVVSIDASMAGTFCCLVALAAAGFATDFGKCLCHQIT